MIDTPTFSEFKTQFNPVVQVDQDYQHFYQGLGFEISVDPQELAFLAYAVNPFGFNDKKDRPLDIRIGSLAKKSTVKGLYRCRKNRLDVYRYSFLNNEARIQDHETTSQLREFFQDVAIVDEDDHQETLDKITAPMIATCEVSEMNTTLVHEMQHAADYVNKSRGDIAYSVKLMAAVTTAGFMIHQVTDTALTQGYKVFVEESINKGSVQETIGSIGIVYLPVVLSSMAQIKLLKNNNVYLHNPAEVRARSAEKITHLLSHPIKIIPAG